MQDPDHLLSSSPDNTEVPLFTEEEVEASLKKMSKRKAPGPDDITSDMFILGGEPVLKYLTKTFNEILTTTQIPPTWDEAKVIIIYKKGDPGDIKNYRPISLLSHSYKLFTRLLQTRTVQTQVFNHRSHLYSEPNNRKDKRIQSTAMCRFH